MRQRALIERIQAEREKRGLSYQNIVDLTESNGEPVSLSTVRRVFTCSVDVVSTFKYEQTILPIANALGIDVGAASETGDTDMDKALELIEKTYQAQIKDLKTDKWVLRATILLLVAVMIYLIVDALHGNWGLFQYPVV